MDKDQIRNILDVARLENWPYSKVFVSFKAAGVETYEVNLDTYEVTYFGRQEVWKKPISLNLLPLKIKKTFSSSKLAEIWDKHQKGKTSYAMFIHAITTAGVRSYLVDIHGKIITFSGVNPKKQHCENIS